MVNVVVLVHASNNLFSVSVSLGSVIVLYLEILRLKYSNLSKKRRNILDSFKKEGGISLINV
ncbi:MAG TPA: hypothetical protein DCK76_11225 [Desulfotomaculum sp.]|nr:hypothetical protein [Desulfotomaculum sp.]HBY04353.1 hypothetical protein [Desulfotomaculum sp.]